MNYRIWYSTESFANYIIEKTDLTAKSFTKRKMYESDANNAKQFHTMPDHIKKILYLDAPDIIVEIITSKGFEPIFSIEESKEAGTGHNAFQRFARLAASVENNVPALYIYPEAVIIERNDSKKRSKIKTWDKINPLIFKAMDEVMTIYDIPALLFYYPTYFNSHLNPNIAPGQIDKGRKHDSHFISCPDSNDSQMVELFNVINEIIKEVEKYGIIEGRNKLLKNFTIRNKRSWMNAQYILKNSGVDSSPLTSTIQVATELLLNHLSKFCKTGDTVGELISSRKDTIIYCIDAGFRGDPYPGALAAIDYLKCRKGKTFEDRERNLVLCFGKITVDATINSLVIEDNPKTRKSTIRDFTDDVKRSESKNLLKNDFFTLKKGEIPRYYMQVRYGSTFSKVKHIRVFSYFADAILFPDGSLWRDA